MIRVGIDVGGTNTDAVVMRGREVLCGLKTPTTADVIGGVAQALRDVVAGAGVARTQIGAVMIGTTHFTNALVERRKLSRVGVLRLALPATRGLPPGSDWPEDFQAAVEMHWRLAHGGYEYDGRPLGTPDPAEILGHARAFADLGLKDIAVSGAFSILNDAQETAAAELIRQVIPDARLTLSSQIGRLGLLERENAAILNACLGPLGLEVIAAFRQALAESGITAPFYLTQNDGTLMAAEQAARFPILTVASGPTNSMRGAAFLSGEKNAIVVDIGGTTSDVGVLQGGFPRQAGVAVEVGGVRTNFRMPDVYSIGLGGGSLVASDFGSLGPQSVGYAIHSKALVFGGGTLTATDIAVAAGVARLGDPTRVADLPWNGVRTCYELLQLMVFNAVERMRTSAEPLPVIVVGGGSILLGDELRGQPVTTPPHFGCANAVGAAMAQVSGEVDRVMDLDKFSREEAIAIVREAAETRAVAAGAARDTLAVIDVEDVPLAYIGGNATRIRVRVVGDLNEQATKGGSA
ncbi:hydantoinase subunit beta [Roseateles aquatilis]|uniref:Hydantoinase subunit beta n=1 Tax=Roseateles aquatilis TaxID=431061 RepID=A0A246IU94_9BURK|nr:hydantoinase/oxoprolinase family protein [Roseateles aquatilis]OWQ83792.1 hydantoinase subunit beta [Roseateles aquatilis]